MVSSVLGHPSIHHLWCLKRDDPLFCALSTVANIAAGSSSIPKQSQFFRETRQALPIAPRAVLLPTSHKDAMTLYVACHEQFSIPAVVATRPVI